MRMGGIGSRVLLAGVWMAAGILVGAAPGDEGSDRPFPVLTPLAAVELEPVSILWPPLPVPTSLRETDRLAVHEIPSWITPEFLESRRALLAPDFLSDAGDPFFKIPEVLLDGALTLAGDLFPRKGDYDWEAEEGRAIASRITEWEIVPRAGRVTADLARSFVDRETRFFLAFEGSYLNTLPYELGFEDLDYEDFRYEQGKVLLDAVRRAYLMKYRFRPEERIRDDAFGFRGWSGPDFALLPPVMAGYLYLRGLERRFTWLGLQVGVALEPLHRWAGGERDLLVGAGVEVGFPGFPVFFLASAGVIDGEVEMDFVGIGTGLGMVRKALRGRHGKMD